MRIDGLAKFRIVEIRLIANPFFYYHSIAKEDIRDKENSVLLEEHTIYYHIPRCFSASDHPTTGRTKAITRGLSERTQWLLLFESISIYSRPCSRSVTPPTAIQCTSFEGVWPDTSLPFDSISSGYFHQ